MRPVRVEQVLDGGKPSRRLGLDAILGLAGGATGYFLLPDGASEWLQLGVIAGSAAAGSLLGQGITRLLRRRR